MIYLITIIIALALAGIEAVSYQGFIAIHMGIPALHFYFLSLIMAFFPGKPRKLIVKLFFIICCLISIVYFSLIFLETFTYPNFVYSHVHVNPLTFQFFLALAWFHLFILRQQGVARGLILAGLLYVGIDGAGRTLASMYKGLGDVVKDPVANYAEKMTKVYPGFYPTMQAIIDLTPADSTILIPPQGNPWELEGNGAMVTYFLYPRQVVNTRIDAPMPILSGNVYALIAKGSWKRTGAIDYGWPKIPVSAKQIWHFDIESNTIHSYLRDFNPATDTWDWGLIEVSYE